MRRLLWAGVVAAALHGALLLIKFAGPQVQPPRPLPQGICLTLKAMQQQEKPKVRATSKPPPPKEEAKPAVKPAAPPKPQAKPVVQPRKVKEQPVVVPDHPAPVVEAEATKKAEPASQQTTEEPQRETVPSVTEPAAGPTVASDTEEIATEATPLYRQNPPPDYPTLARRRGQEGTVQLEVLVNSRGGVNEVRLAESSGHKLLDRAAMAAVKGWLFQPGQRGEQTIDMWVRVPIRFALHD